MNRAEILILFTLGWTAVAVVLLALLLKRR